MKRKIRIGTAAIGCAALAGSLGWTAATRDVAEEMIDRARHFLMSLDEEQRDRAIFAFSDEERFNWHFIPRDREGLPYGEFTPPQRRLADRLLGTVLSHEGTDKVLGIMVLEQVLFELEGRDIRDSDRYYFTVFDEPSHSGPWGWRVEGHHLSLNVTLNDGRVVATSPAFMGSNPAIVGEGNHRGLEVLAAEQTVARELLALFAGKTRDQVVFDAEAPPDILTGTSRVADPGEPLGVAAGDMTAGQRDKLVELLNVYLGRLRLDLATEEFAKIESAGLDGIHFAWAGGAAPGEPHYYRLHGPTFLIEYDNTQNNANHIHSVWRDLSGDFGRDLLAEHYEDSHSK
jgi:hypothetical protein